MATITRRTCGWQVQIRRKGHQPLSKHFSTRPEALRWARLIESELDRGIFVDRSEAERTTFREILRRYEQEVTPAKKGAGPEKSRIGTLLRHPLAERSLASLRSADFASYRDQRLTQVSGTTVNKELNLAARVIDTARKDWSIQVDNAVRLIRRPKNNRARERRLEAGEESKLMAATESVWLRDIAEFALETAMRRGELVGMRWSHLNLAKRTLRIPDTKIGEAREIPLSTRAIEIINGLPRRIDGRVFGLTANSISQAFERAVIRARIPDLRFHDLRHEATTRLFERGLNPMQVAAITGHKTLQMLKRYTHLRAEDLVSLLR